eukprot:5750521-Prymnesium_polylepis.1
MRLAALLDFEVVIRPSVPRSDDKLLRAGARTTVTPRAAGQPPDATASAAAALESLAVRLDVRHVGRRNVRSERFGVSEGSGDGVLDTRSSFERAPDARTRSSNRRCSGAAASGGGLVGY